MDEEGKVRPLGAGHSSFDLVDSQAVLRMLGLRLGDSFLDLACGRGAYALAAAPGVGEEGRIYAFDLWPEGIELLKREASARGLRSIRAVVTDAAGKLPLEDASIDVCLVATVLHDFVEEGNHASVLKEVVRVLKPGGRLAVIEFMPIDGPPGPPRSIRLAPDDVLRILEPYGFVQKEEGKAGAYNYTMTFSRPG